MHGLAWILDRTKLAIKDIPGTTGKPVTGAAHWVLVLHHCSLS